MLPPEVGFAGAGPARGARKVLSFMSVGPPSAVTGHNARRLWRSIMHVTVDEPEQQGQGRSSRTPRAKLRPSNLDIRDVDSLFGRAVHRRAHGHREGGSRHQERREVAAWASHEMARSARSAHRPVTLRPGRCCRPVTHEGRRRQQRRNTTDPPARAARQRAWPGRCLRNDHEGFAMACHPRAAWPPPSEGCRRPRPNTSVSR